MFTDKYEKNCQRTNIHAYDWQSKKKPRFNLIGFLQLDSWKSLYFPFTKNSHKLWITNQIKKGKLCWEIRNMVACQILQYRSIHDWRRMKHKMDAFNADSTELFTATRLFCFRCLRFRFFGVFIELTPYNKCIIISMFYLLNKWCTSTHGVYKSRNIWKKSNTISKCSNTK